MEHAPAAPPLRLCVPSVEGGKGGERLKGADRRPAWLPRRVSCPCLTRTAKPPPEGWTRWPTTAGGYCCSAGARRSAGAVQAPSAHQPRCHAALGPRLTGEPSAPRSTRRANGAAVPCPCLLQRLQAVCGAGSQVCQMESCPEAGRQQLPIRACRAAECRAARGLCSHLPGQHPLRGRAAAQCLHQLSSARSAAPEQPAASAQCLRRLVQDQPPFARSAAPAVAGAQSWPSACTHCWWPGGRGAGMPAALPPWPGHRPWSD